MEEQNLSDLPAERLVEMIKDKRKAEASLRQRLREAEGRAETAEASVLAFQRDAFTQQASEAGVAKTALADLDTHVDLKTLLGESGLLDSGKAGEALDALKAERPHLFERGPVSTGDIQFTGAQGIPESASWSDVLRP